MASVYMYIVILQSPIMKLGSVITMYNSALAITIPHLQGKRRICALAVLAKNA